MLMGQSSHRTITTLKRHRIPTLNEVSDCWFDGAVVTSQIKLGVCSNNDFRLVAED